MSFHLYIILLRYFIFSCQVLVSFAVVVYQVVTDEEAVEAAPPGDDVVRKRVEEMKKLAEVGEGARKARGRDFKRREGHSKKGSEKAENRLRVGGCASLR